jgi:cytochrome c556
MIDEQTASTEDATAQTTMADLANSLPAQAESTSDTVAAKASTDNVGDFSAFVQKLNTLTEKVEATSQKTAELANSQQADVLNKEIAGAVERINESVGGDADMAELFLEKQYRDNPDLKKVWDARHTNPEALDKALGILGQEWAAKNANVIDPTVAENQRALKESQKGGATVQVDSLHQELDKMESGEFMNYAHKLAQGG